MVRAGELLGERQRLAHARTALAVRAIRHCDEIDRHEAVCELRSRLDRLREPRAEIGLHDEPVDDHLDRVLELLVELDLLLEQPLLAVDLDAAEALAAQLLEDVLVLALAVAHHRRVDGELRPRLEAQHLVDDLLDRLAGDRAVTDWTVRAADSCEQEAQVVVDLGDRADRRARVARGRLLVDRDRRREPVDRVDVGFLHHLQELPRVGRERLDVAALAFGVDRVEGKRGLSGAAEPGDADQLVPRQPDGDVLEIVLSGAVDNELVARHSSQSSGADRTGTSVRSGRLEGRRAARPTWARRFHERATGPSRSRRSSSSSRCRLPSS